MMGFSCQDRLVDLSQPRVMGILNVTPDSFSDGGLHHSRTRALRRAEQMVLEGVDIIDVGGESTRPGGLPVSLQEELDRVLPVIEGIRERLDVAISVDTSKPEVMRAAMDVGAVMINDVKALREPGALEAVGQTNACVCLMHMRGEPRTMQEKPIYGDVVHEVRAFLLERVQCCLEAGFTSSQIVIDPGFGFGKTLDHNLVLFRNLHEFTTLGYPVLVGLSRKSMIGRLIGGVATEHRLYGSIAAATLAAWMGAAIIRVHDVRATVEALRVCQGLRGG